MRSEKQLRAGDPGGLRRLNFEPATELDGTPIMVARELLQAYHIFAMHLRSDAGEEDVLPTFSEWLEDEAALMMLPEPERLN